MVDSRMLCAIRNLGDPTFPIRKSCDWFHNAIHNWDKKPSIKHLYINTTGDNV